MATNTGSTKRRVPAPSRRAPDDEAVRASEHLFLANQVKEEFLAHMSTELRAPLNNIINLAGLILEERMGPLTEQQRSGLDAIIDSGSRLRSQVDRILDLCNLDIGMTRFMPERLSVAELLTTTLERLEERARKRRVTVTPRFDRKIGAVTADKQKLSFIIDELVGNAIKVSAQGARILVTARQARMATEGEGGTQQFVEFSVEDQGPGIFKEDLERIFTGFETAGASPMENGSLGLGLALVRRFVHLHSGRIWVDSTPGRGSSFTFILPREGPLPGGSAAPRIMIASANDRMLQMLSHCLKEEGYEVTIAATGLDVLSRGIAHPPDLFFLDLPLTEMDGYEVCRGLKADAGTKHVPVLLVVPDLSHAERLIGARSGADDILAAPPDIGEMLARIRTMITRKLNYEFLQKSYDIVFSQSRSDPLTGLFNLRQFWEDLNREVERSRRYNRFCSLAMIDIDCFKQYNDRYGHLQGDEVLKQAAEIFREHIRTSDIAARYGGEEFVVIMPETGKELALLVGEKLRGAFAGHPFPPEGNRHGERLTVSIGIATFPLDGTTPRELVDVADKALYRAKEGGRNRIVAWESED